MKMCSAWMKVHNVHGTNTTLVNLQISNMRRQQHGEAKCANRTPNAWVELDMDHAASRTLIQENGITVTQTAKVSRSDLHFFMDKISGIYI